MEEEDGDANVNSSNEECLAVLPARSRAVRHSKAQINCLNYYYEMGMRGCSKEDILLIEKASGDTHLSIDQVKVRHL